MRFCILASGSKGNSLWVEHGGQAVIVDNGLSLKEFKKRAESVGLCLSAAKNLVISHEHTDHVRGVGPLARKLGLVVHVSKPTAEAGAYYLAKTNLKYFEPGEVLDFGALTVKTFTSSHDCADPSVFVFECHNARLGLATDLGVGTTLIKQEFLKLTALILEFNHDLQMLLDGPYPYWLKQRVRSRLGHLSNEQASEMLSEIYHNDLKQVVLAHLSEVNNTPNLAQAAAQKVLQNRPTSLAVAGQWTPTEVFEL
ncbi:MAG: MBL fold metallo-hydrolase [Deltaproteobacteria bacterium]|nr:MBL fold metallo-hydrolase [Deltaproteobacteria bacterium]